MLSPRSLCGFKLRIRKVAIQLKMNKLINNLPIQCMRAINVESLYLKLHSFISTCDNSHAIEVTIYLRAVDFVINVLL